MNLLLTLLFTWLLFALFVAWLTRVSPRGRDGSVEAFIGSGLIRVAQVYSRLVHGLRVEGREHVPDRRWGEAGERGLLIVANHTAGIDPILLFAALPFEPRFVMGEDMRVPILEPLFSFGKIIYVDREGNPSGASVREIVRELKGGGVIGLFAEGHIERPPRQILPFREGVGLFVRRTGALVLPVVIDGTPQVDPAWASMHKFSRSRVRFLPVRDYAGEKLGAKEIAEDLRGVFLEATGWPANDSPPRVVGGAVVYEDGVDALPAPRHAR
ncbi:MAG: lysophospholipid acyltransferase family protein [Phycisphaerales bacterium]